jgi:subtilase family serine protease
LTVAEPEGREDEESQTVTVTRKVADLEVSAITFTVPPKVGGRTTAVAQLTNRGQKETGVFNVKWYHDAVLVGYGSHRSLLPGEVSDGNVRFDWFPASGAHTLRFEADVDNHVVESHETNNVFQVYKWIASSSIYWWWKW